MADTAAGTEGRVAIRSRDHKFYVRMSWLFVCVALLGFVRTYWIPVADGTFQRPPLTHLHALFFYGWTVLFMTQSYLAASGRLPRHREIGVGGVALATAMVFLGVGMAMHTLKRSEAAGFGEAARALSILPLSNIALFGVLIAVALLNVRKPEIHKRLMLIATVVILQPAVARMIGPLISSLRQLPPPAAGALRPPPPIGATLLPLMLTDLLIVLPMVHDLRTTGRVNPTYWWAGGALISIQLLRIPLSETDVWHEFVRSLGALFP